MFRRGERDGPEEEDDDDEGDAGSEIARAAGSNGATADLLVCIHLLAANVFNSSLLTALLLPKFYSSLLTALTAGKHERTHARTGRELVVMVQNSGSYHGRVCYIYLLLEFCCCLYCIRPASCVLFLVVCLLLPASCCCWERRFHSLPLSLVKPDIRRTSKTQPGA